MQQIYIYVCIYVHIFKVCSSALSVYHNSLAPILECHHIYSNTFCNAIRTQTKWLVYYQKPPIHIISTLIRITLFEGRHVLGNRMFHAKLSITTIEATTQNNDFGIGFSLFMQLSPGNCSVWMSYCCCQETSQELFVSMQCWYTVGKVSGKSEQLANQKYLKIKTNLARNPVLYNTRKVRRWEYR